jgi:uncharacterized protein (TIGR02246 family)
MTKTDVDKAVRALYGDLLDAWNRRDAGDFARLFAPDGHLVGFDGSQAASSEIESHLRPIFDSHPTAAYVAKVLQVREVPPAGGRAAVLRAIAGMVPPGQDRVNPDVNAVQSLVAEEHEGTWWIVLFQTTPAQYHGRPDLAEQHTAEIQQLRESHG